MASDLKLVAIKLRLVEIELKLLTNELRPGGYLFNGITIFHVYLLPETVSPVAKKTYVGLPFSISTCGRPVEFIFFRVPLAQMT